MPEYHAALINELNVYNAYLELGYSRQYSCHLPSLPLAMSVLLRFLKFLKQHKTLRFPITFIFIELTKPEVVTAALRYDTALGRRKKKSNKLDKSVEHVHLPSIRSPC